MLVMVVCRRVIEQGVLQQGVPIVSVAPCCAACTDQSIAGYLLPRQYGIAESMYPLPHVIASMHCNAQQVTSCSALTNRLVRLGCTVLFCAVVPDGLNVCEVAGSLHPSGRTTHSAAHKHYNSL